MKEERKKEEEEEEEEEEGVVGQGLEKVKAKLWACHD